MPNKGQTNIQYPTLLEQENKIVLLEPFKGAKIHHLMKCLICNHEWIATPISKRWTLKKHGVSGCPNCNEQRKQQKFDKIRQETITKLNQRGIIILDEKYDGRLRIDRTQPLRAEKILVRNVKCGHEFLVTPLNLIQSDVVCGVCGPINRPKAAQKHNEKKWAEYRKTADVWQQYKSKVAVLTEQNYRKHKNAINPNDLPRGLAGEDGAYHLDHIVSKRYCFENYIPVKVCAAPSNLQMLPWRNNIQFKDKLKFNISSSKQ